MAILDQLEEILHSKKSTEDIIIDLINTHKDKLESIESLYFMYDKYVIYDQEDNETHVVPPTRLTGRKDSFNKFSINSSINDKLLILGDSILEVIVDLINYLMLVPNKTCYHIISDKDIGKTLKSIDYLHNRFRMCRRNTYSKLCSLIDTTTKEYEECVDFVTINKTCTLVCSKEEMFAVVVLGRIYVIENYLHKCFERLQVLKYIEYDDVKDIIEEKIKKSLNIDYTKTTSIDKEQLQVDQKFFHLKEDWDEWTKRSYAFDYIPIFFTHEYDQDEMCNLHQHQLECLKHQQNSTAEQDTTQENKQDPNIVPPQTDTQPIEKYPCIEKDKSDEYTKLLTDLEKERIITKQNNEYKWNIQKNLFTYFCHALRENKWLEVNEKNQISWKTIAPYYSLTTDRLSTTLGEFIDKDTNKLKKVNSLNGNKGKEKLNKVLKKYLNLDIL